MKIVTNVLENIAQIQWFPIIGLIIFLILFVFLVLHVIKMNKQEADSFSRMPLEESDSKQAVNNQKFASNSKLKKMKI
jgi:cbb3-type cytochrome oxidase subunit 3